MNPLQPLDYWKARYDTQRAEITATSSASAPSKVASPSGAFSVTGGSPAAFACELLAIWSTQYQYNVSQEKGYEAKGRKDLSWYPAGKADTYAQCIQQLKELCRQAGWPTERQPQENVPGQPRRLGAVGCDAWFSL